MRHALVATAMAAAGCGAKRCYSIALEHSRGLKWETLSSDTLSDYTSKAFGITEASHGVVFTDVLGLDDELLDMIPDRCVGIILCHPMDAKIAAIKESQHTHDSGSAVGSVMTYAKQGPSGGCGPCSIINVLGNASLSSNSTEGPACSTAAAIAESTKDADKLHTVNQEVAKGGPAVVSGRTYHYTSIVPLGGSVVELDSLQPTPIVWGPLASPASAKRPFIAGSAKVLKAYFDTLPGRTDFAAVAVSVNATKP
eukprot:GILI01006811.1.p1 GENE.GILI01006811.1~~GILI01006811.1.p1  ORF type:complete len:254 (+),score=33.63 GILI01006811.1:49-810(+)